MVMKRLRTISIGLILASLLTLSAHAQKTGIDLFNEMGESGFVKSEGQSRLSWLPDNMGYMETEKSEDGYTTFFRVNPANGRRSALFSERAQQALISEFNASTGKNVTGLPFSSFRY